MNREPTLSGVPDASGTGRPPSDGSATLAALHAALTACSADGGDRLAAWLHAAERGPSTYRPVAAPHGDEQHLPLHRAAELGSAPAVRQLLAAGARPDARTRFTSPLHARQTALHRAAAAGHADVVRVLLEAGADPEVRDALGRGPLWLAARRRHPAALDHLLHASAIVDARDAGGRTPLHAALLRTADEPFDAPAASAVLDLLLNAGADPNATCPRDPAGYTAWRRATALGPEAERLLDRLREAGADPDLAPPVAS